MPNRLHRPAVLLASGALLVGGLAGCGSKPNPANAKLELTAGFTNFANTKNIAVTFHFSDPQGNLSKSLKKDAENDAEKAVVDRVLKGSFKVTATHTTGTKRDVKIELDEGSTADFAITFVGEDLYLHIDKGFLTEVGGQDAVDGISQFAPALGNGGTLRISGLLRTLESSGLAGAVPTPQPSASFDPKAVTKALLDGLNSAITVVSVKGSTYTVTADLKTLAGSFVTAVQPVLKNLPEIARSGADDLQSQVDKIPAGTVSGTVKTKGKAVSEVAIDLESIVKYAITADPSNAKDAPDLTGSQLLASFDSSAPAVTAPSGATNFDIGSLIKQFLSGPLGTALKNNSI